MTLCRYKDALGRPGEGAHAWRLGGLAGVDLLLTAAAAYLLAGRAFPGLGRPAATLVVFAILMVVAVALHRLFCVDTALNRRLGLLAPPGAARAGGGAAGGSS